MTQPRSLDWLNADNKKTRLGGFFVELAKAALESSPVKLQLLAFHEVVHTGFSQAEPLIGFAAVVGVIRKDFFPLRIGAVQVGINFLRRLECGFHDVFGESAQFGALTNEGLQCGWVPVVVFSNHVCASISRGAFNDGFVLA